MTTPHNGMPAIHPGEYLREGLEQLGMTRASLAAALGVSSSHVSRVLQGKRPITAELALRLGSALGQSPEYWLNLQATYNLKTAQIEVNDNLHAVQPLTVARPAQGWRLV